MSNQLANIILNPKNLNPLNLGEEALTRIVKSCLDYQKVCEQERTKREGIQAWREVNLKQINKDTEILRFCLEHTFKERRDIVDGLLKTLDKGIESDSLELINQSLNGIMAIVQIQPFSEIKKLIDSGETKNMSF